MKCPLITAGFWADPKTSEMNAIDCFKEKCAWWAPAWDTCIANVLAIRLTTLQDALDKIEEKMPHVEQFKK